MGRRPCPAKAIAPMLWARRSIWLSLALAFAVSGAVLSAAAGKAPANSAAPDKANASASEMRLKRRARRMAAIALPGQSRRPITRPPD